MGSLAPGARRPWPPMLQDAVLPKGPLAFGAQSSLAIHDTGNPCACGPMGLWHWSALSDANVPGVLEFEGW